MQAQSLTQRKCRPLNNNEEESHSWPKIRARSLPSQPVVHPFYLLIVVWRNSRRQRDHLHSHLSMKATRMPAIGQAMPQWRWTRLEYFVWVNLHLLVDSYRHLDCCDCYDWRLRWVDHCSPELGWELREVAHCLPKLGWLLLPLDHRSPKLDWELRVLANLKPGSSLR